MLSNTFNVRLGFLVTYVEIVIERLFVTKILMPEKCGQCFLSSS